MGYTIVELIERRGMKPNINPNKRNRKKTKRGRKTLFDKKIFKERFRTIERVFAWEDKFKRLLIRFERISAHHYEHEVYSICYDKFTAFLSSIGVSIIVKNRYGIEIPAIILRSKFAF